GDLGQNHLGDRPDLQSCGLLEGEPAEFLELTVPAFAALQELRIDDEESRVEAAGATGGRDGAGDIGEATQHRDHSRLEEVLPALRHLGDLTGLARTAEDQPGFLEGLP